MAQIEEATRRLEQAVSRLEATCAKLAEEGGDRRKLAAALAEARADYAALAEAADSVATRLDGTIARLNAVIEE